MKTMTLDELRNLPPLTHEQIFTIENAKVIPDEDCPIQTEEELKQFKPWYELHSKKIGVFEMNSHSESQVTLVED